jgi:hypothetical protein
MDGEEGGTQRHLLAEHENQQQGRNAVCPTAHVSLLAVDWCCVAWLSQLLPTFR